MNTRARFVFDTNLDLQPFVGQLYAVNTTRKQAPNYLLLLHRLLLQEQSDRYEM